MADVNVNIDDIISEWGNYYINQGQNMDNLKTAIYKPSKTESYFGLYPTTDTKLRNSLVEMDEVLQAYQDAFTPKGDAAFRPWEVDLFQEKIDWQKNPSNFINSWAGFLAGEGNDRTQWPLIRYIIEQHILKRRDQDKELTAFKAEYVAPTPGTAGPAMNRRDGIRPIIWDMNGAGRSVAISTGALETDPRDLCSQLEDFVMQIAPEKRAGLKYLFVDTDVAVRYSEGKREKYNRNYAQASDLTTIEKATQITVVGLDSMSGSQMIWTSYPENMKRAVKRAANADVFEVEKVDRTVKLYTDYHEVCSFLIPEFVYHNDQDLD